MAEQTRRVRTYAPVAGDDRLLVKVDESYWVADDRKEYVKATAEIEAFVRGKARSGMMVFVDIEK
jgi:hypothetical protein